MKRRLMFGSDDKPRVGDYVSITTHDTGQSILGTVLIVERRRFLVQPWDDIQPARWTLNEELVQIL